MAPDPMPTVPDPDHPTPTAGPPAERPGSDVARCGRFRVVRGHARGGGGQVRLAHDEQLGRPVALKELLPGRGDDAVVRRRFLTEAEITARLGHPGVVPVYALDQDAEGR